VSEIEGRITRVLRGRGKMEVSEIVEELKEEFPDLRPNTIGRRVRELSQKDCIDRTGKGVYRLKRDTDDIKKLEEFE